MSSLQKGWEGSVLAQSQIPTIALFCFIFKALFSKKFIPFSSSESELESVTEFSGGLEGTALLLVAPLVF